MPETTSSAGSGKVIFNKYELGRLLGRGATAKVYHARNLITNHSVAIKCFPKRSITSGSTIIEREVTIMRRLHHPHTLRLIEVLATRNKIYFVLELAKNGELFDRLAAASTSHFSEPQARRYFQQLIAAVHYCHSRGVFHRDLKPENLLLDEHDNLKISDFGLSSKSNASTVLQTLCGTPAYVAPDILTKKGYSGAEVDVWSCGIILFVLTAGYLPFNDTNLMAMYRKIYRGVFRCPRWMSPELKNLISRLLDTNPKTRITVDEIGEDEWFKKDMDAVKWAKMKRGLDDEKKMAMDEGEREMNAFDIISFSSGLNLSCLFDNEETETERGRERFVVGGDVLSRVEEVDGVVVRRVGGGVVVEERKTGSVAAVVGVRKLTEEMVVVEVEGGEAWREKLRIVLTDGGVDHRRIVGVNEAV